jgi:rhodanese-related sulfurtransferase/DNA-binding transcriptional ArsR family regulator
MVQRPIYEQLARLGQTMGNPNRLRLLDLLDGREWTVETIAEESGIPVKNTSAQLQVLRAAHLVTSRRAGNRVYYRLADESVSRFLGVFQEFAQERLADLRQAITEQLGDLSRLEPVTVTELGDRHDSDVVIVDVRSTEDYATGHLPGAISVPSEGLLDRLSELPAEAEIVAYCHGPYCVTSAECVRLLRQHGRNARHLAGGFAGWHRAGAPLEAQEAED